MAKNVNFKNTEPIEVQIKRAILNGMTFTDCEKCFSQKRSIIILINKQITPADKKALIGKGLQDCVSQEMQEQIADLLRKGKTAKAISQQTKLPVKVINAISEARIEKVCESLSHETEKPVFQELTDIANKMSTNDTEVMPEIDVNETGVTVAEPAKQKSVSDEIGELLFQEFNSGKTYAQISEEYGMTIGKVKYAINKYRINNGIAMDKKFMTFHTTKSKDSHKEIWNNALDMDMVNNIAELIMKGFGNVEIESMTGVRALTISKIRCKRAYANWTKDYDFPRKTYTERSVFNKRTMPKETFDEVIKMIFDRKTDREIAEALHLGIATVNFIRNKRSYEKITRDMNFPEPLDSKYRIEINLNSANEEAPVIETSEDSSREEDIETCEPEFEATEEATVNEPETEESIHIGSRSYFMTIAKAFAADASAAVIIKDGTLITYAVDKQIGNAIMRVIAMSTIEELKDSNLYLYGGVVSYEYLKNMIVCLGLKEVNIPKD